MSDKNEFSITTQRFRKLIDNEKYAKIPRAEIAKATECDTSTITKYYNGQRQLSVDSIIKFSKYFNVSSDYLLGLSDVETTNTDIKTLCEYTGLNENSIEQIRKLCFPAEDVDEDDIDFFGIKYYEYLAKIYRKSINCFISSNTFDYLMEKSYLLSNLDDDILAYLSLYCKDFDYFECLIQDDVDLFTKIKHHINAYKDDPIHFGMQDRRDLILFNIQRSIVSYFEQFADVLFEIDNNNLAEVFDYFKMAIFESAETASQNIETYTNKIDEIDNRNLNDNILKLKELYESIKARKNNTQHQYMLEQ